MNIRFLKPSFPKIHSYLFDLYKMYFNNVYSNNGPYVRLFEHKLQKYLRSTNRPIVVNNASTGLIVALTALNLPKGSSVIVPSFTFAATVQSILWCGLQPLYCDIDCKSLNIDCKKVKYLLDTKSNISAVLAVNCFGNPCDIENLEAISKEYKVKLVFDSAGAIGSMYKGRHIGNFGDAEVFSFHATKSLPIGEGGAIVFKDSNIECIARKIIDFGFGCNRSSDIIGLNGKMSEFSAIVGIKSLKKLDYSVLKRNEIAKKYNHIFKKYVISGILYFQEIAPDNVSSYQIFNIVFKNRLDKVQLTDLLLKSNIFCREYFNPPCHKQEYLKGCSDYLPITDSISNNVLSLPIWDDLKKSHLSYFSKVLDSWNNTI